MHIDEHLRAKICKTYLVYIEKHAGIILVKDYLQQKHCNEVEGQSLTCLKAAWGYAKIFLILDILSFVVRLFIC